MSRRRFDRVYARFAVAAIEFLTLAALVVGVAQAQDLDAEALALQDANPNLVANGGFRADLEGWSFVDPAVTWDALDAAANPLSGSLEVDEPGPTVLDEISAARQCVVLPAPGTYQLNAKGNGGTAARFQDFLEVRWAYLPSGGNCADIPSNYGVLVVPIGSGWKQPAAPALIEAGADTWTPTATIEIELVIERNQGEDTSGIAGRFDDVSLTLRGDTVFTDGFDG